MVELFGNLINTAKNLVYGPSQSQAGMELIMNSRIRELAKANIPFDKKEIIDISRENAYAIAAPYFALKYLDGNSDYQQELVQNIIEAYVQNPSRGVISEVISKFIEELPEGVGNPVNPNKLARLQLWTPSLVHERANIQMQDVIEKQETPALVAYSGLFALEESINQLDKTGHFYVLFPKYQNQSLGLKVTRLNGITKVEPTLDTDIENEKVIALIDDVVYTGNTSDEIKQRFTGTQFADHPLFRVTK